jgi:hypothetical protein
MTLGERIEERRLAARIPSQSALARAAGVKQSTLNGLINRPYRWSPHLVRIATALHTSVAYLTGEIDDPDAGASMPPPPGPIVVTMGVVLPPERALARMFEALLAGIDRKAPVDEQALLLAQRLPIGLSQLRDLLPDGVSPPREPAAALEAAAIPVGPPPR